MEIEEEKVEEDAIEIIEKSPTTSANKIKQKKNAFDAANKTEDDK